MDLPELTGSERQIAWANQIRSAVLGYVEPGAASHAWGVNTDLVGRCLRVEGVTNEFARKHADNPERLARWMARLATVLAQSEARYWIDRRTHGLMQLCIELADREATSRS